MSPPLPLCYLNGEYVPLAAARVSPFDRAFLFGDAVYEVVPVYRGRPFRLREHLNRLDRSLGAIRMEPPLSHVDWAAVCLRLSEQAGSLDAHIYLQVTRGAEFGRNHAWPDGLEPTLFAYATLLEPAPARLIAAGVAAITAADTRWARRDIKSTALLANVLLKRLAVDAGCFETLMIENGHLTEGSSTTVHVIAGGIIHLPPDGPQILPGTTRSVVTEIAAQLDLPVVVGGVPESLLRSADEIWLGFATRGVIPVTRLDGNPVGSGTPGPLFTRVHGAFLEYVAALAGTPPL